MTHLPPTFAYRDFHEAAERFGIREKDPIEPPDGSVIQFRASNMTYMAMRFGKFWYTTGTKRINNIGNTASWSSILKASEGNVLTPTGFVPLAS